MRRRHIQIVAVQIHPCGQVRQAPGAEVLLPVMLVDELHAQVLVRVDLVVGAAEQQRLIQRKTADRPPGT
jgi:hypothetical protein